MQVIEQPRRARRRRTGGSFHDEETRSPESGAPPGSPAVPRPRRRRYAVVLGVGGALLFVAALYAGPLGPLVDRLFDTAPLQRALEIAGRHKLAVLAAGAVGAGAVAAVLVVRRHWRLLGAGVAAGALLVLVYGAYQFREAYPRANVFDAQRFADAGAIVLGSDIRLTSFDPEPQLRVARTPVVGAAFPVIDFHFHLASLPPTIDADRLVAAMDA